MIAAIGQWLVASRFGRALLAIGGVLLAIGAAARVGFEKGRFVEVRANAQRRIEQAARDAQAAQQVTQEAAQAADEVRQAATARSPPDPDKRDDFDNTGLGS